MEKAKLPKSDKIHCPVCNAPAAGLLVRRNGYSLHECNNCGLTFKCIAQLSPGGVQRLQDVVYTESYLSNRSRQYRLIHRMNMDRLGMLRKQVGGGELLEIGCGTGDFLAEAQKSGFTVLGIDTSRRLVQQALDNGRRVKYGRIENLRLPGNHFDAVCVFHVLEHLEAPGMFLRAVRGLLKKQGVLFIITPNSRALTNKLFGLRHPVYTQEDHLLFFSPKTLGRLLLGQGFETVYLASKEYAHHLFTSFLGFCRTLLKTFRRNSPPAAAAVNAGTPETKRTAALRPGIKRLIWQTPYFLGAFLYPLSFLYRSLVEKSLRGHELIIMARKTQNG